MNKKHIFYFLSTIFLSFCIASCTNKTETLKIDNGEGYFPVRKGKYWIYNVDSTTYKLRDVTNHRVDIFRKTFQVKEVLGDTLRDAAGRLSYKLERYERLNATQDWIFKDVWFVTRTNTTAERIEEDQRFLKLGFPVATTTSWKMVQHIDPYTPITIFGESIASPYASEVGWPREGSRYLEVDVPKKIGNRTYDSTATVQHVKSEGNLVNRRYCQEIYAKNVGLIFKQFEILESQCTTATCINAAWAQRAEKGFILTMTLESSN